MRWSKMTDLMDGPEDKKQPSEALKKLIEKMEFEKKQQQVNSLAQQQMMMHLSPYSQTFDCCPACGRTWPGRGEIKEEDSLLTKDEKELLTKLEELVKKKKQFLNRVQRVQNY